VAKSRHWPGLLMARRPLKRSTAASFWVFAIAMLTAAAIPYSSTFQPDVPGGAYQHAIQVKGEVHYITSTQYAVYVGAGALAAIAAVTGVVTWLTGKKVR
jgi:hypothetical protein